MPNAKVLESKKAAVEVLSGKIKEATSVVFVDYKGITVAKDAELRKQFRDAGVEYTVVKNTLTRFAAKENGYDFDEVLNGTTAMASTTGDPIAPARIVCEFAKKNKLTMHIKGGIVEGSVLFTAYSSKTAIRRNEIISAAVAVGIPKDAEKVGVIMEFSGLCDKLEAEMKIISMVREALSLRNYEIKEIICQAVEAKGSGDDYTTVFAALAMW